jgi:hypothetical protein
MHARAFHHATGDTLRIPLEGATTGRLRFTAGAQHLDIVADASLTDLCHARFAGAPPLISAHQGSLTVRHPRLLAWPLRSRSAAMRLNASLPWEIDIRGGADHVTADLRHADLIALSVHGGASRVTLDLPPPRGVVEIAFAKGVHQLAILRPHATAARLRVRGGASQAQLDDQTFNAVGGPLRWQTPGYETASDSYSITIGGGASGLTVGSSASP